MMYYVYSGNEKVGQTKSLEKAKEYARKWHGTVRYNGKTIYRPKTASNPASKRKTVPDYEYGGYGDYYSLSTRTPSKSSKSSSSGKRKSSVGIDMPSRKDIRNGINKLKSKEYRAGVKDMAKEMGASFLLEAPLMFFQ